MNSRRRMYTIILVALIELIALGLGVYFLAKNIQPQAFFLLAGCLILLKWLRDDLEHLKDSTNERI